MNIPHKWRWHSKTLKKYGNHKGGDYLKKILEERKKAGNDQPLILPKNIRVISGRNGQFLMPLSDGKQD